ncbi:Aminotransferase, DegT/DnrJ/EryC1/StrS family [Marinobacter nitratireducens]|uniref:Aminotransferase, DegT/DnrJ/EryC1/StrS family n=1 Tax=Marinobacter nitratireducens TaxID=1137280 RepID=A0A072N3Z2_9GAMM|nr:DegT/DnrJ/EryC1/StrS family aminotransferase [Marinobacter nitratireducens]KEF31678.1 Aminotransferase, DegT/DnrJ/EryC1/StrS family [Marinobacter nitratireducens]
MPGDIITVTKPSLPELDDLQPLLRQIWDSGRLTNGGSLHQELESRLCEYLGVEHLSLFANGTLALVTALQALGVTGEVITTPYTFVATSHALIWNKLKPVFVDIEPDSFNMDPMGIEAVISDKTTAILPVHCYGTPANVAEIQAIADKHDLRVIYDAAHAFGVNYDGSSLLDAGDVSVLSFHATKVFNTFEGGALVCRDAETKRRVDYLKNFGFADEVTVVAPGINGKMNEFQAAVGLLQLDRIDDVIAERQRLYRRYADALARVPGVDLMPEPGNTKWNYAYCPVLVRAEFPISRDALYKRFREANILVRRYFYPLVTDFPIYHEARRLAMPNARKAADQILCLPLYPDLSCDEFDRIIAVIQGALSAEERE